MTILEIASSLVELLRPGCERIEIAGSLRRGKANPKDIEIVAIPQLSRVSKFDLFGNECDIDETNHLESAIYSACLGNWAYDTTVKRDGPRYKRLRHHSGVACDLFIADARRWGAIYTIRTGPGEFSQRLVMRARRMGYRVHEGLLHGHTFRQHIVNGILREIPCEKGDACPLIIPTLTEEAFFSALKMDWTEPSARGIENVNALARERRASKALPG